MENTILKKRKEPMVDEMEEVHFFAEPKVGSRDIERIKQAFVKPNHQMRRSLGDFSKDLAFETALQNEAPQPKKSNTTVALSFSFVSLDAPSGTFSLSSGTSSSEDLRIKNQPNANSFQNFQELLHKGLPSPSPLRRPLIKNLHFGVFGTQENASEHSYQASIPQPVCDHQNGVFIEEPKWKEDEPMEESEIPEIVAGCSCSHNHEKAQHAFFGIYDAHGGRACADYVHQHLHSNVTSHPIFKLDPETALLEGIVKTERDYIDLAVKDNMEGTMGTCVCVALIFGNQLMVANVGDSSAILCRNGQYIRLSYPHTAQNLNEKERVEKSGGILKDGKICHPSYSPEVFSSALTRSVGDIYLKHDKYLHGVPSGLIAEPEIAKITLTSDDQFLFLASRGYWAVVSPKETIDFIQQMGKTSPNESCKELTDLALKRSGTNDITTLLINLKK